MYGTGGALSFQRTGAFDISSAFILRRLGSSIHASSALSQKVWSHGGVVYLYECFTGDGLKIDSCR